MTPNSVFVVRFVHPNAKGTSQTYETLAEIVPLESNTMSVVSMFLQSLLYASLESSGLNRLVYLCGGYSLDYMPIYPFSNSYIYSSFY